LNLAETSYAESSDRIDGPVRTYSNYYPIPKLLLWRTQFVYGHVQCPYRSLRSCSTQISHRILVEVQRSSSAWKAKAWHCDVSSQGGLSFTLDVLVHKTCPIHKQILENP